TGLFAIPNTGFGINIEDKSTGNIIGGTNLSDRNIISGNTSDGVRIIEVGTSQNSILGNYIGLGADGLTLLSNQGNGIFIGSGATNNSIGNNSTGSGNVISGNSQRGISVSGATTTGTQIRSNLIGTDASGLVARANSLQGVLSQNASIVAIGNTISGNTLGGFTLIGSDAKDALIQSNTIGLNLSANAAIPNGQYGLYIGSGEILGFTGVSNAQRNQVGGTAASQRNIISGNNGPGVWIAGSLAKENVVEGNWIGTDGLGQSAIPNTIGVLVSNGANLNIIGGTSGTVRNILSGNLQSGIVLKDSGTINNLIRNNLIGLDSTGSVAVGNEQYGIRILDGAAYTSIVGNVISGNFLGGILIETGGSNTLYGNRIGTDITGTLALGNGRSNNPRSGVRISASSGNIVGGLLANDRNTISGNHGDGVVLSDGSFGNSVLGNAVGTDTTGTMVISNTAN
ncbi:MAG: beta strand repeat-containing protein, partial [Pirellula sp.]